jgi:hypothetical protein
VGWALSGFAGDTSLFVCLFVQSNLSCKKNPGFDVFSAPAVFPSISTVPFCCPGQ